MESPLENGPDYSKLISRGHGEEINIDGCTSDVETFVESDSGPVAIFDDNNDRTCRIRNGLFDADSAATKTWILNNLESKHGSRNVIVIIRPTIRLFYGYSNHLGKDVLFYTTDFWARAYNPFKQNPIWTMHILDQTKRQLFSLNGVIHGGCPYVDSTFQYCQDVSVAGLTHKQAFELAYYAQIVLPGASFYSC